MENQNKELIEVYPKWSQLILQGAKVFLVASSAILILSVHQPVWAQGLVGEETEIIRLTNDLRQKQDLPVLIKNERLAASALAKANDMAINGYFGHADKNGNRMSYWMTASGYNYLRAGENLAKGFTNPADVLKAWINSPTHYANLINPNYQEIGIGIAQGYIDGRFTTFAVQHFGEPMPVISLVPVNIAKTVKSVMGDNVSSIATDNPMVMPSWQPSPARKATLSVAGGSSYSESTTVNASPAGLMWVAYQDTKNILRQSIVPTSLAADIGDIGLPSKGYQAAQVLFMVLAFLGFWGWLSMLTLPIYAWLGRIKNKT